jgi:aminopeptidase N
MNKFYFLFFLLSFLNCSGQDLKSGGKLRPEQALMDIRHYTISLDVSPVQQSINGYTEIELILSGPTDILLFDLVHLLKVEKVWIDKKSASFEQKEDLIYVRTTAPVNKGRHKVKIQYGGKPGVAKRAPWEGGFQWAKDSLGNHWVAITCQGEGAKIYFPCKDHPSDEPNEGADLFITVPNGLVVAGPGLLQKVTNKKNTTTYHWKTNYTINNYSILFNIGKYKVASRTFTTINGKKVPMQFYVLEEHFDKAEHHLDIFEQIANVQEKYFGEYPWVKEKMAIAETPHLGMEHQTMNAYGNKFRYTKVAGKDFDWLMHHEFGHEWWGNKVTGIDWADMWIQEGICVFGDAMYVREKEGEESYLKWMQKTARQTQNKKPVVMGKDLDTDTVYHPDIYSKGAFFMHTLRYVIGDAIFFPTLKKLATDSLYTYNHLVSTDDVEKLFSSASAKNLRPLFDFYLRTTQKLEVLVKQTADDKYLVQVLNLDMPLPMEIITESGSKIMMIDKKGIDITSKSVPQVDPKVYYLKKLIFE